MALSRAAPQAEVEAEWSETRTDVRSQMPASIGNNPASNPPGAETPTRPLRCRTSPRKVHCGGPHIDKAENPTLEADFK
jgi:hypothetical protein